MRRIPFTAAQSMLEELAGRVGDGLVVCFKTSEYGPEAKKAARRFQSAFAMMRTRYRNRSYHEQRRAGVAVPDLIDFVGDYDSIAANSFETDEGWEIHLVPRSKVFGNIELRDMEGNPLEPRRSWAELQMEKAQRAKEES